MKPVPVAGWSPAATHAPRWPREDKLRLIACSAAVALIYGILSAALFFGSHEFLRQYAVGLLIVALALLPVVGMVAGYVVRAAKPWREAFAIAGIVTLAVLLVVLGMEASVNTCGAAGSSSCDTAASASGFFIGPPIYAVILAGTLAGKALGRRLAS
jgi:hypothetical protein